VHPPEPLNVNEMERLRVWERRTFLFYALAIPALAIGGAAAFYWSDVVWARRLFLVLVLALVAVATVLQMLERCPRCGARLRTTLFLRLRQRCHFCGVPFAPSDPV